MENFNNLENKIIRMEDKIDNIKSGMDNFHKDNKEQHSEIFQLIGKIETKKADKEIVDQIRADISKVVWIILGAVIVAVLALVIKQ